MLNKKEEMKGLFFIMKGQFRRDNDEVSVSGYNPYDENTPEHYQVRDCITFHCIHSGGDYEKALQAVKRATQRYGSKDKYFKFVSEITNEDYYQTHYKGAKPLTPEQLAHRQEGRCPRVSPAMKRLFSAVYSSFGDYYRNDIERMEEEAYADMKSQTPFAKTKRLLKKSGFAENVETPKDTSEDIQVKKSLKKVSKKETEEKKEEIELKPFKKPLLKRKSLSLV